MMTDVCQFFSGFRRKHLFITICIEKTAPGLQSQASGTQVWSDDIGAES